MLRAVKARNARSKREIEKREPKIEESGRTFLFLRGSSTNKVVQTALLDLYLLKKPNAIKFSRKNQIYPFENTSSLNFLSEKNDASFLVVGSCGKRRQNTLIFVRMFDYQVLDMLELRIEAAVSMIEFKNEKCFIGLRPMILFVGSLFESSPKYQLCKSMFLDFFHGKTTDQLNIEGIQYAVCLLTEEPTDENPFPPVFFRLYMVKYMKEEGSGSKIELEEMGPRYDFLIRRTHEANEKMMKEAMKKPKKHLPKIKKNIDVDIMGDKIGQIHLAKQNIDQLQTRKFKGLKRKIEDSIEDELSLNKDGKKNRRVTFKDDLTLHT
ncbi:hypothetical protein T552_01299 [Pneumocystis carinii B80]|uniref:Ribosome production factor 2 homolog n=1 Tax=Pneumocystis carinii (strain B80) TaxID=1408658 RepID=A0A0W4ZLV7_PNEC8|nr:hypothetical protein T552_01299 [Pneumocystis carinii B80]KTW29344.1 hypothetical protein T552_01299 [Pneumocystis carinii B80]